MPLDAGTRLGPYEILAPLGAGGMGEVYRGRDTRLDRTVAIKIVKAQFSERFEREARSISALNHPHICTLHDVGDQDGMSYLVLEFVEGESLAEKLRKGPLPLEQALRAGQEIASALGAAQRKRIVHRDLKPANVMLTKAGVKLLDFGLARVVASEPPAADGPTMTEPLTERGAVMGTLQYMSPEQVEGKETDSRSDIFALGLVLYEMATGRRAFAGESRAALMAAILREAPVPMGELPAGLQRVIGKCLAKDPDERWQSAEDLADQLRWMAGGSGASTAQAAAPVARVRVRWERAAWVAVTVGLAAAAVIPRLWEKPAMAPPAIQFSLDLPDLLGGGELSPDGSAIAYFVQTGNKAPQIAVRPLRASESRLLSGTEGTGNCSWSPDGRAIAFLRGEQLWKVDLSGGSPQPLARADPEGRPVWSGGGFLLIGSVSSHQPIRQIPEAGGEPKPVTTIDTAQGETGHFPISLLPDQRRFLYYAASGQGEEIRIASVDGKGGSRLAVIGAPVVYTATGHLLYPRGDTLLARRLDADTGKFTAEPVVLASGLSTYRSQSGATITAFTASRNGVVAWPRGRGGSSTEAAWYDRGGRRLESMGNAEEYSNPALSPDGKRVSLGLIGSQGQARDLWTYDVARGTKTRFTFDAADDFNAVWSRDGEWIYFSSNRRGPRDLYRRRASGVGEDELVYESKGEDKAAECMTADGQWLLFNLQGAGRTVGVYALPLAQGQARKPQTVLVAGYGQQSSQISPDGKFIAYNSNENGQTEIFIQTYPPSGAKWQVSNDGGVGPQWNPAGNELFYTGGNTLMAVAVKRVGAGLEMGKPAALFEVPLGVPRRNRFVVGPDGKRFLIITVAEKARAREIQVLVNWPSLAGR